MKKFSLAFIAIMLLLAADGSVQAKSTRQRPRGSRPLVKKDKWTTAQKAMARKAIVSLEELDRWLKYYPEHTQEDFERRTNDTRFVTNEAAAKLPSSIGKELKSAGDAYDALQKLSEMVTGLPNSQKFDEFLVKAWTKARTHTQNARKELAKH